MPSLGTGAVAMMGAEGRVSEAGRSGVGLYGLESGPYMGRQRSSSGTLLPDGSSTRRHARQQVQLSWFIASVTGSGGAVFWNRSCLCTNWYLI